MEKIRMELMASGSGLQRLGKPSTGRAIESLGKTNFRKSNDTIPNSPPSSSLSKTSQPLNNYEDDDDDDDDLDLDLFSSRFAPPKEPVCKRTGTTAKPYSGKTKSHRPFPGSQKSGRVLDMFDNMTMPPSNQLVKKSLSGKKETRISSPLMELSSNGEEGMERVVANVPFPIILSPSPAKPKCKDTKKAVKGVRQRTQKNLTRTSPTKSPRRRKGVVKKSVGSPQPFPMDVEVTRKSARRNSKKKVVLSDESEEDELALTQRDEILTYGAPRPFPMVIDCPPRFLRDTRPQQAKRSPEDSEEERAKRSRSSSEPSDLNDCSVFLDKSVDPSSLCAYCDGPWPSMPSSTLVDLLEKAKKKSYQDPRPGNPMGLQAPLNVFVEVCQRHRLEMNQLPLAIQRGWPTTLNFAELPRRIQSFKQRLSSIVDNPSLSQFWKDLRDDMKELGKAKIASVTGQFATFERALPGYYGEQGSFIIHQTLYSIYPTHTVSANVIHPLSVDQFFTHVLVPETALSLIKEDLSLSTKADALQVMHDSKEYGVMMFPEQAQSDDVAKVGEKLAWERARQQMKLLEARGETDADIRKQIEKEEKAAKLTKSRGIKGAELETIQQAEEGTTKTAKRKVKGSTETIEMAETPDVSRKPQPKWRKVADSIDEDLFKPRQKRRESGHMTSVTSREKLLSQSSGVNTLVEPQASLHSSPIVLSSQPPLQNAISPNKWNFNLRTDPYSSESDDVDFDAPTKEHITGHKVDSDSDVLVLDDGETPKARRVSKPKRETNITAKQKDTATGKRTSSKDRTLRCKTQSVAEKYSSYSKSNLAKTKRKKKKEQDEDTTSGGEKNLDDVQFDWLHSDSD